MTNTYHISASTTLCRLPISLTYNIAIKVDEEVVTAAALEAGRTALEAGRTALEAGRTAFEAGRTALEAGRTAGYHCLHNYN